MEGHVLVVDDDLIVIKSCERILAPEGFEVKTATNAKEAMELLDRNRIDIVITDLKMPEIDGIELIRWIRDKNPTVGIIVITGYPSQETIKDALELGIVDYLPKPFSPALLLDVATKAISLVKVKPLVSEKEEETEIETKTQELKNMIDKNKNKPGALIPVLQNAQELVGFLPPSVQKLIAKGLKIPVSEVHAVVSFYSFFTMKPKGKHSAKVCLGTACYVKRANEILDRLKDYLGIDEGEVTEDRGFSLETVRCLGACGLAPVVVIDHDTHGAVEPLNATELLKEYK